MGGSRLYTILALIAALTFCATAFVTYAVDRSRQMSEYSVAATVPAMQVALRLAEQASLLTAVMAVRHRSTDAVQLEQYHRRLDELVHDMDDGVALLQRYYTDTPAFSALDQIQGRVAQLIALANDRKSTTVTLEQQLLLNHVMSQAIQGLVSGLHTRLTMTEGELKRHHSISMALLITVCLSTLMLTGIIALLALRRSEREMLEQGVPSYRAELPDLVVVAQPDTSAASHADAHTVHHVGSSSSLSRIAADPVVTLPVIDTSLLNRIRQLQRPGAANLLHRVIANYLEQTPRALTELAMAINRRDVMASQRCLQGLKGSSHTIGASQLADYSRSLEQIDGVPSEQEYHDLQLLYRQVEQVLLGLLQQDQAKA
ncbi:MAG: Hpt domain-containing protein [Magnetococcales bacterium]|nr:Hpt domain-containing protein [Magnetococcales bacterium]